VNPPAVVRRGTDGGGGYHMWYTGEAKGRSWIDLATSADGKTWTRAAVHRASRYGQTRPLRCRGFGL